MCGKETEVNYCQDLEMAYGLVLRMEILSRWFNEERKIDVMAGILLDASKTGQKVEATGIGKLKSL